MVGQTCFTGGAMKGADGEFPHHFIYFMRIPNFLLRFLNILKFFRFEPQIIFKLFFNTKSVTTSENQRIIFKSLFFLYYH